MCECILSRIACHGGNNRCGQYICIALARGVWQKPQTKDISLVKLKTDYDSIQTREIRVPDGNTLISDGCRLVEIKLRKTIVKKASMQNRQLLTSEKHKKRKNFTECFVRRVLLYGLRHGPL